MGEDSSGAFGAIERDISVREKLILSGLYLSKFDTTGLRKLGFESFLEVFNVIGYALGSRPASVKNYRDEFDPLFPNGRKGWHKRGTRNYCLSVYESYKSLEFESFSALVGSFFGDSLPFELSPQDEVDELRPSSFAQRLITGLAAERYFEAVHASLPEFAGRSLENTTREGCGYDFRLRAHQSDKEYWAVEVKGLKDLSGSLSMTCKEHHVASHLADRFFLFIVRNFREAPLHNIFQNPLAGSLQFRKVERVVIQTSWATSI